MRRASYPPEAGKRHAMARGPGRRAVFRGERDVTDFIRGLAALAQAPAQQMMGAPQEVSS